MSAGQEHNSVDIYRRKAERERAARIEAETLLEKKSLELFEANAQIRGALDALQEAQSQLVQSEKLASIGQLAAGVAHEINNPIGYVCSNLNTLTEYASEIRRAVATLGAGDGDLDATLDDLAPLIAESIEGIGRVQKIVRDLKDFSHVDAPELQAADLKSLITKTINVASNELKYVATVSTEFDDRIPLVRCYGGQIAQVIMNLLVNAAQAMEGDGTITVRTELKGDRAEIEIADTGAGIPHEAQAKIFDAFFTTKAVGVGTGLGLHIVKRIVDTHDGTIVFTSEPGVGTTFRITLPVNGPAIDPIESGDPA